LREIVDILDKTKGEIKEVTDVFLEDYYVKNRLCGVGKLSYEDAILMCRSYGEL